MTLWLVPGCTSSKDEVHIFIAGDTHGWITPCGCAANQSGGLARRASLINQTPQNAETVVLDVGGSASGTSAYQQLKFQSLLRGMQQMKLGACNIGGPETEFAPDALRDLGNASKIVWLSSNLTNQEGQAIGVTSVSFELAGITIDVAGVIDPALVNHPSWNAGEPVQAILKTFANSKADVHLVLAYFDEPGLRSLAEALPEVDFIVGGPTGQTISPTQVGRVTILSATNKGKFLAALKLRRQAGTIQTLDARIAEVSSNLPEDPLQLANLKDYYSRLATKDYTVEQAGLVLTSTTGDDGYAIAGSTSCLSCHSQDQAIWHQSKHAHAWEVLVSKTAQYDPQCQQCHTTGYGMAGGFVNVAQSRSAVHVGCENCHGPSAAHVANPRHRTPFQAKEQCLRCHDHENSPQFEFNSYWAKIFHAGAKHVQ